MITFPTPVLRSATTSQPLAFPSGPGARRRLPIARGVRPIALAILIASLVACIVPVFAGDSPILQVDQMEIDLGPLIRGQTGVATFVLRNEGNAPLRLLEVEPGCRCTVVDYAAAIAPGASGEIVASLDTDSLYGTQARWVRVRTNDPMNPEVRLVLLGEVIGSVQLFPHDKARISDRKQETSTAAILIRKEESEAGTLVVSDVETGVPWLVATPKRLEDSVKIQSDVPTSSPGDWRLDLSLAEGAPYGWSIATVTLKTGLQRQPTIEIPVRMEHVAPVELSQDVVRFPDRGPVDHVVLISVREPLDPLLLSAETRSRGVELELEPAGGRHYRLHVRWNGKNFPKDPIVLTHGKEVVEVAFEKETQG